MVLVLVAGHLVLLSDLSYKKLDRSVLSGGWPSRFPHKRAFPALKDHRWSMFHFIGCLIWIGSSGAETLHIPKVGEFYWQLAGFCFDITHLNAGSISSVCSYVYEILWLCFSKSQICKTWPKNIWATKKKLLVSMKSWLCNRDPYNGSL